ncbi:MAG: TetR/AcrR family transcriptional regulator [Aestuariivirga sp.]|uniref:TetR/AcrR family transcriptional regulator n=1 Tax=Aestuariivirga sp. TaxID=2650926 RepID=UPI0025BD5137|nr:TetR/AcrR family transcriptional regulator [Aestuariivirga sp.]MCA3562062.1 TetR/AcrR family transcriptional regulator [Aestuariivirga sp.]
MTGPKQRRSKDRVQSILKAALRCFRAEGFRGTSISRICAEAGISPGHLYHYFDSKEAIVEAIVESDRAAIRGTLNELALAGDPIEALMTLIVQPNAADGFKLDGVLSLEIYAESTRNPRVAAILAAFNADARASLVRLLLGLQRSGRIDTGADPHSLASVLIAVAEGLMLRESLDPAHKPEAAAPHVRQVLLSMLTAGVDKN